MKRVLLINDSRFESMILADMFKKLDYEPYMTDEFDALVEIEEVTPQLIVVNYIMEEVRGDKLISIIKAGHPNIQCIMSSSNPLDIADFKASGVDGIMRTPASMFTLKDLLNRVIVEEDDTTAEDQARVRFCDHCNADISAFSENIIFCPFCGEEVD